MSHRRAHRKETRRTTKEKEKEAIATESYFREWFAPTVILLRRRRVVHLRSFYIASFLFLFDFDDSISLPSLCCEYTRGRGVLPVQFPLHRKRERGRGKRGTKHLYAARRVTWSQFFLLRSFFSLFAFARHIHSAATWSYRVLDILRKHKSTRLHTTNTISEKIVVHPSSRRQEGLRRLTYEHARKWWTYTRTLQQQQLLTSHHNRHHTRVDK